MRLRRGLSAAMPGTPGGPGEHGFMERQYGPRAQDYLTSPTHAAGADLDQIEALAALHRPDRALDLGCGGGHVAYRLALHAGRVVACDVTPAMLEVVAAEAAARGLDTITVQHGAAEHLPFDDGAFELVVSRFSAHHWADLPAGLREARRVLAAGGRAVFLDTIAPPLAVLDSHLQAIELLRDPAHVRNYSAAEWMAGLSQAGLVPVALTARRLRLEFAAWTARTRCSAARCAALLEMQREAPDPVRRHFSIEPDGSWCLDKLAIEVRALPWASDPDQLVGH